MLTQSKTGLAQPPSRAVDWPLQTEDPGGLVPRWIRMPREHGQPISQHAAKMQSEMKILEVRVLVNWGVSRLLASLAEERGRQRFRDKLHASLEAEPLEDGMNHPAESTIAEALDSADSATILRWIRDICLDTSRPAFAAAVFLCVARQPEVGNAGWREELVRSGLALDDVEVRDAAMQAAEYWADPGLLHVLSAHSEPIGWLDEYRRGLIDDLGR